MAIAQSGGIYDTKNIQLPRYHHWKQLPNGKFQAVKDSNEKTVGEINRWYPNKSDYILPKGGMWKSWHNGGYMIVSESEQKKPSPVEYADVNRIYTHKDGLKVPEGYFWTKWHNGGYVLRKTGQTPTVEYAEPNKMYSKKGDLAAPNGYRWVKLSTGKYMIKSNEEIERDIKNQKYAQPGTVAQTINKEAMPGYKWEKTKEGYKVVPDPEQSSSGGSSLSSSGTSSSPPKEPAKEGVSYKDKTAPLPSGYKWIQDKDHPGQYKIKKESEITSDDKVEEPDSSSTNGDDGGSSKSAYDNSIGEKIAAEAKKFIGAPYKMSEAMKDHYLKVENNTQTDKNGKSKKVPPTSTANTDSNASDKDNPVKDVSSEDLPKEIKENGIDSGGMVRMTFNRCGFGMSEQTPDDIYFYVCRNKGVNFKKMDIAVAGDIVYFKNTIKNAITKKNCGITDIGIYIGNKQVVIADVNKGVVTKEVESVSKEYQFARYGNDKVPVGDNAGTLPPEDDRPAGLPSAGKNPSIDGGFLVTPIGSNRSKVKKTPLDVTYCEPVYPDLVTVGDTVPAWVLSEAFGTKPNATEEENKGDDKKSASGENGNGATREEDKNSNSSSGGSSTSTNDSGSSSSYSNSPVSSPSDSKPVSDAEAKAALKASGLQTNVIYSSKIKEAPAGYVWYQVGKKRYVLKTYADAEADRIKRNTAVPGTMYSSKTKYIPRGYNWHKDRNGNWNIVASGPEIDGLTKRIAQLNSIKDRKLTSEEARDLALSQKRLEELKKNM